MYYIRVFIPQGAEAPRKSDGEKMTLKDMLGDEIEKYYDGWGSDPDGKDEFFNNVDEETMNLAKTRAQTYTNVFQLHISKR